MSVYLSVRLSVCPSVCLSVCLSIYLSIRLSIHPLRASLSVFCRSVFMSVKVLSNQNSEAYTLPLDQLSGEYFTLFVCLSVCLSVCLFVCLFVYLFVYLSLSVFCLSVFTSVKVLKNQNVETYTLPFYQLPGKHFTLSVYLSVRLSIHPLRATLSVFYLFVFV